MYLYVCLFFTFALTNILARQRKEKWLPLIKAKQTLCESGKTLLNGKKKRSLVKYDTDVLLMNHIPISTTCRIVCARTEKRPLYIKMEQ